jgi:RNA-splicing ligase RtcB
MIFLIVVRIHCVHFRAELDSHFIDGAVVGPGVERALITRAFSPG